MAEAFIGQISPYAFNFPPKYWAYCNGQILNIQQNQALFSLLGTTFGGNGSTTFALPNLQGQVPVHNGGSSGIGLPGGEAYHSLSVSELPAHTHTVFGTSRTGPSGDIPTATSRIAPSRPDNAYGPPVNTLAMAPQSIGPTGDSLPHENRQPLLTLNFCIALYGIFPSRN